VEVKLQVIDAALRSIAEEMCCFRLLRVLVQHRGAPRLLDGAL
jgi:hypothetical protein